MQAWTPTPVVASRGRVVRSSLTAEGADETLEAIAMARVELMRARGALLDPALERACLAATQGEK